MDQQIKHDSLVPSSIQLLFDNDKLDFMKILCLINALSSISNKQRKVEELLFYYSLVNFDLIKLFNIEKKNGFTPSPIQYFRFQTKINEILLAMSNLKFIEIKGEMSNKLDELKVKLLSPGKDFFQQHSTEYFQTLFNRYIEAHSTIKYSSENVNKIKEGI
ncbi:hypothetical protein [Fictibacillus nanhaiensis]|uniref:hypothetical protein n=1 Tax=Fictibacillus nanhaiensis TaxID=742169 RepID=UPI003C1F259E